MPEHAINLGRGLSSLGFDQAQQIEGHRRELVCSGQDVVDADGNPSIQATWPRNSTRGSTICTAPRLAGGNRG